MTDIRVQQGINLESEISLITIPIPSNKNVDTLLRLIGSFHPIFIRSYTYEKNLSIKSHLTSLWREIGTVLIKLANEEITYEKARELCVDEIIRERISSMSTIPLLFTSHSMGLETTPTLLLEERVTYTKAYNRHYTIGTGINSQIIYSIPSSLDPKIANEVQKYK